MASISVVLPTYNRATLLVRALNSILNQKRLPDQIIVVDDGSTDETQQLIAEKYPAITYLYQENQGVSAARNYGIREARSDWIAFLDSDDEWLPDKLQKQMAALEANPSYAFCHTDEIWIRRGKRVNAMKKHQKYGGDIFEHCLPLCVVSPSSVLIEAKLFEEVGVFDESFPACEDYDLWLRICCRHPVLFIEEPLLVKYGGHEDQLSQRHWGMDRFRVQALQKLLKEAPLDDAQRTETVRMLVTKLNILINGARKRGKDEAVRHYEAMLAEAQAAR